MKFFVLLFNLYLLVLPCLPCGDVDVCAEEYATTISLQAENIPTKEHQKDYCTPFCHCACCASNIIFHANTADKHSTNNFLLKEYNAVIISISTNNANAIWQPPKELYI